MGKLQPLGGVHGHKRHGTGRGVIIVKIGIEGNIGKISCQGAVAGFGHIGDDGGLQLLHVFSSGSVFLGVLLLQGTDIAGFLHNLVKEQVRGVDLGKGTKLFNQVAEGTHTHGGPCQILIKVCLTDHLVKGLPLPGGNFQSGFDAPCTDASGGHIDDALQPQVVPRGGDDTHVGENVFHFRPVEEAGAAHNAIRDAVTLQSKLQ